MQVRLWSSLLLERPGKGAGFICITTLQRHAYLQLRFIDIECGAPQAGTSGLRLGTLRTPRTERPVKVRPRLTGDSHGSMTANADPATLQKQCLLHGQTARRSMVWNAVRLTSCARAGKDTREAREGSQPAVLVLGRKLGVEVTLLKLLRARQSEHQVHDSLDSRVADVCSIVGIGHCHFGFDCREGACGLEHVRLAACPSRHGAANIYAALCIWRSCG